MTQLSQLERSLGPEAWQRLLHLDATPLPQTPPGALPRLRDNGAAYDYDVVLLGGGLSLLVASLLAQQGLRVAVYDRAPVGAAHREWNASWPELMQLCEVGFCNPLELQSLLLARYDHGICRWHGGRTTRVRGVLDCAVDAGALLRLARRKAQEAGVAIFDRCNAGLVAAGTHGVQVRVEPSAAGGGAESVHAALVLDGRGARSPYACTDLLCPTVGGVIEGLEEGPAPDQINPQVGEILVSTEHVEQGHQHLWEAFPGRPGQTAVYLFYYARRAAVQPGALQALYARFFARLPHYKRGAFKLLRPTFGYIPGWSRLCRGPQAPHPRVILLGDAAARHSPLTFCGFGAMLRSLAPVVRTVVRGRQAPHTLQPCVDDQLVHAGTGALALLMAEAARLDNAAAMNRLLDVAFATLEAMGPESYTALLKDRMDLRDFAGFLRRVSGQSPEVYRQVWNTLGPTAMARWGLQLGSGIFS